VLKAAQKLGVEVTDLGLNDGDRQRIESLITSMPPYTGLFTASVLPGVKQFIGQANAYAQAVGSGQTLAQAAAKFPAMPVTIAHLGESVSANQLTQIAKGLTGAYEQALKRVQQLIDRPATGSVAEFTNQGKPVSPLPKPGHATSPQKKSVDDFSPLQRPMKLADSNDIEKMARQYNVSPDDIAAYMQQHGVSAEKAALDMNAQLLASRKGDNAVKEIGSRPPDGRSPTATAPPDSGPAWKPSPEAVLKRQADIYKKIRDNDLTGENITVQVDGKTLDAAALDRELVASNGKPTGFTARDMVRLAGSLKDATINIKLHSRAISIIQKHPQLEGSNKLTVYLDLKTVYFINLKVNQTSSRPGFGTALRMQQLVAAEKLGMRGATMTAARSKDYPTGYFTWPKFGFDAELPNKVKPDLTAYLLANPDVAKRLGLKPDALPTHLMLSELLFNADGSEHQGLQAWWKAKGIGSDMGINFSGPSGARFRKMARDMGWLR
jgi:NACalpha-BTF3-like transcription factor